MLDYGDVFFSVFKLRLENLRRGWNGVFFFQIKMTSG